MIFLMHIHSNIGIFNTSLWFSACTYTQRGFWAWQVCPGVDLRDGTASTIHSVDVAKLGRELSHCPFLLPASDSLRFLCYRCGIDSWGTSWASASSGRNQCEWQPDVYIAVLRKFRDAGVLLWCISFRDFLLDFDREREGEIERERERER